MRIMVLAHTHIHLLEHPPKKIIDALSKVDLVIHAGDFTAVRLLDELKRLKEVKAVQGNMDSIEIKTLLPVKEIIEVENRLIGITHGSGSPWGIEGTVRKMLGTNPIEVIIYGHSYRSQNKVIDGILIFNPGKATDSSGILTINGEVSGEIVNSRS